MSSSRLRAVAFVSALSALCGAFVAVLLDRIAPEPAAEMKRGGEEAFASAGSLHPRELPPGGEPLRWTGPRVTLSYRNLASGPRLLDLWLPGRHGAASVSVGGVLLGRLEAGQSAATLPLPPDGSSLDVQLEIETFQAGDGRRLGALLERASVRFDGAEGSEPALPPLSLVGLLTLAALGPALGAAIASGDAWVGGWGALLGAGLAGLLSWPQGLFRSPYLAELAGLVAVLGLVSGALGWAWASTGRDRLGLAGALFFAGVVLGLAATSPAMVVSDAVFQANRLKQVAGGDWFPTSLTQHATPFRFPYGVALFALGVPFVKTGADAVAVVRALSALTAVLGTAALLAALAATGARRAALSIVVLALMPVSFDVFSFGNLANAFAQAALVALFAWWISERPLGAWPVGAALAAAAGLGHLSGAIVLIPVAAALLLAPPRDGVDRSRAIALGVGCALTLAYYASFAPLVLQQLRRLGEGGGPGKARLDLASVAWLQLTSAVRQWGEPALALALVGFWWLRATRSRLDRDLAAFLWAGAPLFAAAVFSPVEARYLYALSLPVAILAATGFERLWTRGGVGRSAALALLLLQAARGLSNLVEAVVVRYRP